MASSPVLVLLFLIMGFLGAVFCVSSPAETNTLNPGQMLRDWEQLISPSGIFRLGFFTPEKTPSSLLGPAGPRYIGIWFDRIQINPVWVGNPMNPVIDSSGALTIGPDGILKITQANGSPIMVNPKPQLSLAGNVSATLLDSGNFIVREVGAGGVPGRVLWQSFDYPSNVLLPGMKIGFNLKTGKEVSVKSWICNQVPSPGAFRLGLDPSGADQLLIWRRNEVYWSSGIWKNGTSSHLNLELSREYIDYEFKFHSDKYDRYFTYFIKDTNQSVLSRWYLDTLGQVTVNNVISSNGSTHWILESSETCRTGLKNASALCISEKPTACRKGSEYFEPKRGYMLQELGKNDLSYYDGNSSLDLSDCHASCWRNCSCIAFQTFSGGFGCQFWPKGSKFTPEETSDQLTYVLDSAKL
ncbi:PREDICTED: G-type lectin S-receptor-like serine/threonine-protein kinase CES101 [Tarenaya hassleriana]|uniref:G-type lectin S-receptor-like serine/threonine-protein kinase CES101 n=1 Tax=Tarenaya hassleriana TaxID=28532 RepID=UPI00053C3DB3|nr:PREDICTED: G-type lectin S-receptor-like serine/threonine-protein kinase CES101 [Tarenaya hassleriana]